MKFKNPFKSPENNDTASAPRRDKLQFVSTIEKFRGISRKYATRAMAILAFGLATKKMQSQHRPNQSPNTLKVMTVDNYLDDNQWNTITVADREAGLCLQDHFTTTALNADTRLAGIFVRHTSTHLPDSELASTGNRGNDLNNFYSYISSHSGFDFNHYNIWYNHQNYGAQSSNGPWNNWSCSVAGSSVTVKSIQGHEFQFAAGDNPGDYSHANTNVPYHQNHAPLGGPSDLLQHGKTLGAATTSGYAALPLYTTNPAYNVASAGNHPDTPQYDGFYHFKAPVNGVMLDTWLDPAELENANGNTNDNLAGFFANYPNFTQELATYYNPDTGNMENFQPPAVPAVTVSNGVITLTNAGAYNNPRKISHTAVQSQAGANGNYVLNEAKFYVYKDINNDGTVDVVNDQYAYGPFTLTEMTTGVTLPPDTYRVLAFKFWSNSEVTPSLASAPVTIVNNTPPDPEGNSCVISVDEDHQYGFSINDFHYYDADGDPLVKIKIPTLPTHGTLKLNGTPITANQEIPANEIPNLTYTPNANYNGTDTFPFSASDGTDWSTPDTMTVNINAVNDAPSAPANLSVSVSGDQVTLSFDPATDIDGTIDHYNIYLDGNTSTAYATSPSTDTNPTITVTNPGNHTVQVSAVDNDGAESDLTSPEGFVDVKENEKIAGLRMYPNPVKNALHINLENSNLKGYEIFDLTGKKIDSQAYFTPQPDNAIDVRRLSPGLYIIRLSDDQNQTGVLKFVKE